MANATLCARMHAHQLDVTPHVLGRLIGRQFPHWAGEAVTRVPSYGTTNAMFRLGSDKVARLPFIPGDGAPIAVEADTLGRIAGVLPVPTPEVLAIGEPDEAYPFQWSVLSWLPGEMPVPERLVDARGLVDDLAAVLKALRRMPVEGGARTAQRGGTFHALADEVHGYLRELGGGHDANALARVWDDALAAPLWDGPPLWLHSDLLPSNLIVDARGRLCGVLDWAAAGVGDPSCELLAAWNVFPAERERFRTRLAVDDASWRRGRGWAVAQAAHALVYYRDTNPGMVEMADRALRALAQESV